MPSTIPMTLADSSQLHAHGYENGTLALEFKSNHQKVTYHYKNFSPDQYAAFLAAESQGSHFYKHIKPAYPDDTTFERHYKDQSANSEGGEA